MPDKLALQNTTLFTIATSGYAPFALNLIASFEASGLDSHSLVVYALDDETERRLRRKAAEPTEIRRHEVGMIDAWARVATPGFSRIASAKYGIALDLLRSEPSVLFVDSDVVIRRDPMTYLATMIRQSQADMVMQFESPKNVYNTGFWYARGSTRIVDLFHEVERQLLGGEWPEDQDCFNNIVATERHKVHIQPLDVRLFACGNQFYDTPEVAEAAYILHFNYIVGPRARDDKLLAMDKVGAILHESLAIELWRVRLRDLRLHAIHTSRTSLARVPLARFLYRLLRAHAFR